MMKIKYPVSRGNPEGFTIIELLMVLVILAVLAAISAPTFTELLDRQRVQAVAAELSTDIAYARSQAGLRPSNLSLDFNQNAQMSCYTLVSNAVIGNCDCRLGPGRACPLLIAGMDTTTELKTKQIYLDSGISIRLNSPSNNWPGGIVNSMRFSSPQMSLVPADARILVQGKKARLEVRVNAMGRIHTCVPDDASIAGIPPCESS